jgi:hypothetical protein
VANFAPTGGEADCVDEPDATVAQLDQALALPGLELAIDALPGRTDKTASSSCDPEHAAQWRSAVQPALEWLFLTAPDQDTLAPVLAAYNQPVDRQPMLPLNAGRPLLRCARPPPQDVSPAG